MNPKTRDSLGRKLQQRRKRLWEEAVAADSELLNLGESRESEIEETAQRDRAADLMGRLDLRAKHEIEEIDAALARIADGRYGSCTRCGRAIAVKRLRALPETRFCLPCARLQLALPAAAEPLPVTHPGPTPADRSHLTDREMELELRDLVQGDGRVDTEELRIVCRHGIVHLDGTLPSEAEHEIVRDLVTDRMGLREIVDHVRIEEIAWERPERSKARDERLPRLEVDETEDVVRSVEEGVDYVPPTEPPPKE
jgi:RNA polymerase-binding transcription factor DksA